MKIMLIGSADMSGKTIGGQYEKTRLVYNFLKLEKDVEVYFCNMFKVGKTIGLLTAVLKGYFSNDCVIVITSTRGTRIISRLLCVLRQLKEKKIVYLIVGNQQAFLKTLSYRITNAMDKLYFEVASMQDELCYMYNVGFFSNCKDIHMLKVEHKNNNPIRICYYSEISYRKGFDRIVRALDVINQDSIKYELDVYGYYASDEADMKKYFESRSFLQFKGVIKREKTQEVLSQYSFMVFPSRHKLEGVPGAIVDAYEVGLPVISSNVGFLPEVVTDKKTGYLFENEAQLITLLENICNNIEVIDSLRGNAFEELKKYDIKESIKRLHSDLLELTS